MTELFPIPLAEQIATVQREIALRKRVYPRFVETRRMSRANAEKEIDRMAAVLETLLRLNGGDIR